MKKLIIGTAQLGSRYGISNYNKKKNKKKITQFLEFCYQNSLNSFDTASDYESEKILGEFIKDNFIKKFNISTKIPSLKLLKDSKKFDFIKKSIETSLSKLNVDILDTVYFHDENDINFFRSNALKINNIFRKYKIKNLGYSLYSRKKFNILNKNKYVKSIQVPINIINKDFQNIKSNKKIIGRSIFLQGLLINSKLNTRNQILKKFNNKLFKLAEQENIDLYSICLNFVLQYKEIKKIIIGFDNLNQLKGLLNFKRNLLYLDKNVRLINSIIPPASYKQLTDPRKW